LPGLVLIVLEGDPAVVVPVVGVSGEVEGGGYGGGMRWVCSVLSMEVYSTNGVLVISAKSNMLNITQLNKGIFVVKAFSPAGYLPVF